MAKVLVCDVCLSKDKLTKCNKYYSVKGNKNLRLDYCDECKSIIPNKMEDYREFVARIKGIDVSRGNKCKYCGSPNGSLDKDVLCKECRETFGHSFYSEL